MVYEEDGVEEYRSWILDLYLCHRVCRAAAMEEATMDILRTLSRAQSFAIFHIRPSNRDLLADALFSAPSV